MTSVGGARIADSFARAEVTGAAADALHRNARYLAADVTAEAELRRVLASCDGASVIVPALPP